jgi:heat-inducible transcriptional repressor
VVEEVREYERQQREMLSFAQFLSDEIFDLDEEVYLDGASRVLTLPEFQDYEPMRSLLRLNEDRDVLKHILEGDMNSDGVQVIIGSEASCKELKDLSVVSSVYKDGEKPVGVLGIIGPKRMEYPKMMALVEAVSKMVNKLLSRAGG